MDKRKVVYLDHVALLSGGELALARILPWLTDSVEAHVVLGAEGPLQDLVREAHVPLEVVPMGSQARDVRKDTVRFGGLSLGGLLATAEYIYRLSRWLKRSRPDLIHTNSLKAALYGGVAGRVAGIPVIWHLRDRIADDYLPKSAVVMVKVAAHLLPSFIIANSEATRRTLPRALREKGARHSAVIHDSVVVQRRQLTSCGPRPFRLCILGRLAPWKGQEIFIQAFNQAFSATDDVEGWVTGSAMFGEEDYAASLQAMVRDLGLSGRVEFRGFRDDIWAELAEVDVLVHSSLVPEPFGQVVLEGMAAGTPVITVSEGGPLEIVTHMVDGVLLPPGDVAALASAMRSLYHDSALRERLATAGMQTAERFSPPSAAAQLLEVYERVAERNSQPLLRRLSATLSKLASNRSCHL